MGESDRSGLIRQAAGGDPAAFEQLMTPLEGMIWRVCWHYTGNREDAADCGQEVMVRLWKNLSSWRGDSGFESWVYRVAANVCLDFLRRRKREKSESIEPLREKGYDPPDPKADTEEQVADREEKERLREGIRQLPEDQRQALVLTQLERVPYDRAAQMLGTTEGTIKSRVNRAKARLKEWMSGELSPVEFVKQREGRMRS